jgi:hypothetical protein
MCSIVVAGRGMLRRETTLTKPGYCFMYQKNQMDNGFMGLLKNFEEKPRF